MLNYSPPREPCGLDLKDVFGLDNKLNNFLNSTCISNDLCTIPKLRQETAVELNTVGINTTNQLIGKFASFDFEYERCVDWLRGNISYIYAKQIVTVVLYRLEMAGFLIPKVKSNWRHY